MKFSVYCRFIILVLALFQAVACDESDDSSADGTDPLDTDSNSSLVVDTSDTASNAAIDSENDAVIGGDSETNSDTALGEDTESENDTVIDVDSETESATVSDMDSETENDTAIDVDSETESDTTFEEDSETENDTVIDVDSETESDTVSDADTETEDDTMTEVDSETESETASDVDSETEIDTSWVVGSAPEARNVVLSGGGEVGDVLTISYDYYDADGDEEDTPFIAWFRGTQIVAIAYGSTYTIVEADNNQEISVQLVVEAQTGFPRVGESLLLTKQIDQWNAPTVSNVEVSTTGEITVGTVMTATYDYADVNGDLEDGSLYAWHRDGYVIAGETGLTYTLQNEDAGKYIQFYVTPQTTTGSLFTGTAGSDGLRIGNIQTCEYSSVAETLDCIEQEYNTTTIGDQVWMAENLNFRPSGGFGSTCYDNDFANCTARGRLYNWVAAMEDSGDSVSNPSNVKGICPTGWHIPSEAELQELYDYVNANNGTDHISTSLKSETLWSARAGIDSFGFNGYPAGGLEYNGDFWAENSLVGYWSTTLAQDTRFVKAWYLTSQYDSFEPINGVNGTSTSPQRYISVRCVKDAE